MADVQTCPATNTVQSMVETVQKLRETAEATPLVRLQGRKMLTTPTEKITTENVVYELNRAMGFHAQNSVDIDYLYWYRRGEQPILKRTKKIRPEINNRIVENRALEIVEFKRGYLFGEPMTYVSSDGDHINEINTLNNVMESLSKESLDIELDDWMKVGGVGYRQVMPTAADDEYPFRIDIPDPRYTFVLRYSGFGKPPVMAVRYVMGLDEEMVFTVYTPDRIYTIKNNSIISEAPNEIGYIPIIEYVGSHIRMGVFEPVLSKLNELNNIASNRMDGVEQFVQSFMKFVNCDIDEDKFKALKELGAIRIKSVNGQNADVDIVTSELDQTQTQTLKDDTLQAIYEICGMPTTTKGGASTSDTGQAVILRDGWQQAESRARDEEMLFKKSESEFLRVVLAICKKKQFLDLKPSDIRFKFTRRQNDNIQSKAQVLLALKQAGVAPDIAFSVCGIFTDPQEAYTRSMPYLTNWGQPENSPGGAKAEEETKDERDSVQRNADGQEDGADP